jgi:hypothetical protein
MGKTIDLATLALGLDSSGLVAGSIEGEEAALSLGAAVDRLPVRLGAAGMAAQQLGAKIRQIGASDAVTAMNEYTRATQMYQQAVASGLQSVAQAAAVQRQMSLEQAQRAAELTRHARQTQAEREAEGRAILEVGYAAFAAAEQAQIAAEMVEKSEKRQQQAITQTTTLIASKVEAEKLAYEYEARVAADRARLALPQNQLGGWRAAGVVSIAGPAVVRPTIASSGPKSTDFDKALAQWEAANALVHKHGEAHRTTAGHVGRTRDVMSHLTRTMALLALTSAGMDSHLARMASWMLLIGGSNGYVMALAIAMMAAVKAYEFFNREQREAEKNAAATTKTLTQARESQAQALLQAVDAAKAYKLATENVTKAEKESASVTAAKTSHLGAGLGLGGGAIAGVISFLIESKKETKALADETERLLNLQTALMKSDEHRVQQATTLLSTTGQLIAAGHGNADVLARNAQAQATLNGYMQAGSVGFEAAARVIAALDANFESLNAQYIKQLTVERDLRDANEETASIRARASAAASGDMRHYQDLTATFEDQRKALSLANSLWRDQAALLHQDISKYKDVRQAMADGNVEAAKAYGLGMQRVQAENALKTALAATNLSLQERSRIVAATGTPREAEDAARAAAQDAELLQAYANKLSAVTIARLRDVQALENQAVASKRAREDEEKTRALQVQLLEAMGATTAARRLAAQYATDKAMYDAQVQGLGQWVQWLYMAIRGLNEFKIAQEDARASTERIVDAQLEAASLAARTPAEARAADLAKLRVKQEREIAALARQLSDTDAEHQKRVFAEIAEVRKRQAGELAKFDYDHVDQMTALWVEAGKSIYNTMQQSFAKIFASGLDGFKGFVNAIKDMFVNLAASIVSLLLYRALGIDKLIEKIRNGGASNTDMASTLGGAAGQRAAAGGPFVAGASNAGPLAIGVAMFAGFVTGVANMAKAAEVAAENMRQAGIKFHQSMGDFAAIASPRGALGDAINSLDKQARDLQKMAEDAVGGVQVSHQTTLGRGDVTKMSVADIQKALDAFRLSTSSTGFDRLHEGQVKYLQELLEIRKAYEAAIETAKRMVAQEQKVASENLRIRELQARGQDETAALADLRLRQDEELFAAQEKYLHSSDAAVVKYGELYIAQLKTVQALEMEKAVREQAAIAARKQNDLEQLGFTLTGRELTNKSRRAALGGDTTGAAGFSLEAAKVNIEATAAAALFAAKQQYDAGVITEDLYKRLTAVIRDELVLSLEEATAAAAATADALARQLRYAYEDLEVRNLIATGQNEAADAARFRFGQEREMQAALDAKMGDGYIKALEYTQGLERVAYATAVAAAAAEQWAQSVSELGDFMESVQVRSLRAHGFTEAAAEMAAFFAAQDDMAKLLANPAHTSADVQFLQETIDAEREQRRRENLDRQNQAFADALAQGGETISPLSNSTTGANFGSALSYDQGNRVIGLLVGMAIFNERTADATERTAKAVEDAPTPVVSVSSVNVGLGLQATSNERNAGVLPSA